MHVIVDESVISCGYLYEIQDPMFWAIDTSDLAAYRSILEEAIRRIGTEPSFDRAARWAQLDASAAEFHDLDTKFYEVAAARDAAALAYARLHPVEFLFDGMITKPDFGS